MAQHHDLTEIDPGSLQDVPQAQLAGRRGERGHIANLTSTSQTLGSPGRGKLQTGRLFVHQEHANLGLFAPARRQ